MLIIILLGGCASYTNLPPGTVISIPEEPLILEQQPVEVEPQIVREAPLQEYYVGFGDVLYVNVSGRPELGSPVITGGGGKVQGSRVDGKGNIHLPMVGSVHVAGLTIAEVQEKLQDLFSRYLNNTWVVVEVAEFRSQPVYLLGQFQRPGTYYLERPTNLLQGLALGGGLMDTANLRAARLIRDGKTLPVDLRELIELGDSFQNVWLRPGDTLFVPDDRNLNVFVFGAVQKPGPVPMPNGRLTLAQAIASAGLDGASENERHIRIIRSFSATRGQLIVADLTKIIEGDALPYPLVEGDIIYVPRSGVGNWNQAISEILPSLQAVSAILQPFVQIKFLTEDD